MAMRVFIGGIYNNHITGWAGSNKLISTPVICLHSEGLKPIKIYCTCINNSLFITN